MHTIPYLCYKECADYAERIKADDQELPNVPESSGEADRDVIRLREWAMNAKKTPDPLSPNEWNVLRGIKSKEGIKHLELLDNPKIVSWEFLKPVLISLAPKGLIEVHRGQGFISYLPLQTLLEDDPGFKLSGNSAGTWRYNLTPKGHELIRKENSNLGADPIGKPLEKGRGNDQQFITIKRGDGKPMEITSLGNAPKEVLEGAIANGYRPHFPDKPFQSGYICNFIPGNKFSEVVSKHGVQIVDSEGNALILQACGGKYNIAKLRLYLAKTCNISSPDNMTLADILTVLKEMNISVEQQEVDVIDEIIKNETPVVNGKQESDGNEAETIEIDLSRFYKGPNKNLLCNLIDKPTGVQGDLQKSKNLKTALRKKKNDKYKKVAKHIHKRENEDIIYVDTKKIILKVKKNPT